MDFKESACYQPFNKEISDNRASGGVMVRFKAADFVYLLCWSSAGRLKPERSSQSSHKPLQHVKCTVGGLYHQSPDVTVKAAGVLAHHELFQPLHALSCQPKWCTSWSVHRLKKYSPSGQRWRSLCTCSDAYLSGRTNKTFLRGTKRPRDLSKWWKKKKLSTH